MPSTLLSGLELLVEQGILDEKARNIARKGLEKLERLRVSLLLKLETLLQQASKNDNKQLLLKGQGLADELEAVENLTVKIHALLDGARTSSNTSTEQ